jgi:hypothetical protein
MGEPVVADEEFPPRFQNIQWMNEIDSPFAFRVEYSDSLSVKCTRPRRPSESLHENDVQAGFDIRLARDQKDHIVRSDSHRVPSPSRKKRFAASKSSSLVSV